jgi:hypothetical protein
MLEERKRERARQEEIRVSGIKSLISEFKEETLTLIKSATLENIEQIAADAAGKELDVAEFEELLQETKDDLFNIIVEKNQSLAKEQEQRLKDEEQRIRDEELKAKQKQIEEEQAKAKERMTIGQSRVKIMFGLGVMDYDFDSLVDMSSEEWVELLQSEQDKYNAVKEEEAKALYERRVNMLVKMGFEESLPEAAYVLKGYSLMINDIKVVSDDNFDVRFNSIFEQIAEDEKKEKEKIAKEKQAKKDKLANAKLETKIANDKEVILEFVNSFQKLNTPVVATEKGKEIISSIESLYDEFIVECIKQLK